MSYMSRQEVMFIPLSIDTTGVSKSNYFAGDSKMIKAVVGVFPYLIFLYMLLQMQSGLFPIIIMTIAYAFIYTYFIRFVILEEVRLKKLLEELDMNSYSGLEHFWGINKISTNSTYDGLIHYESFNKGDLTNALIVSYGRGSTIGVPVGNYETYRKAKEEFMKLLHQRKYDFMWYEIPERVETPKSLEYLFNIMTRMDNNAHKKLFKLQIDINRLFTSESKISYRDYIVIKSSDVAGFVNFRESVEDSIARSLTNTNYIVKPHILNKSEIDLFFEDLLMLNGIDSNSVLKGRVNKSLEEFGTIISVVSETGSQMEFNDIDLYDMEAGSVTETLEFALEREQKEIERKVRVKEAERKKAHKVNDNDIKYERITDPEYRERIKQINAKFDFEIEDIREGRDVERQKEKERKILEERKKAKEKRKSKSLAKKEVEEIITVDEVVEITANSDVIEKLHKNEQERYEKENPVKYNIDDDTLLDDLLLDDLLLDSSSDEVFELKPKTNETDDLITTLDENYKEFEKVDKSKFNFNGETDFEDEVLNFDEDDDVFEMKFDFNKGKPKEK